MSMRRGKVVLWQTTNSSGLESLKKKNVDCCCIEIYLDLTEQGFESFVIATPNMACLLPLLVEVVTAAASASASTAPLISPPPQIVEPSSYTPLRTSAKSTLWVNCSPPRKNHVCIKLGSLSTTPRPTASASYSVASGFTTHTCGIGHIHIIVALVWCSFLNSRGDLCTLQRQLLDCKNHCDITMVHLHARDMRLSH